MGSVAAAAWIAWIAFPAILAAGWLRREVGIRTTVLFTAAAAAVYVVLPRTVPNGTAIITPAIAVIDIVLVLVVFKGDVRLT